MWRVGSRKAGVEGPAAVGTEIGMVLSRRAAGAVVLLVLATACSSSRADPGPASSASSGSTSSSSAAAAPSGDCLVAAAGDVAGEDDLENAARTADQIAAARPDKVLALGDLAYPEGTAAQFADYYDPTWGRFRSITAPTPGNHEYRSDGKGYFDYFDVEPHYAFDLCGWRIVSLDLYSGMREAAAFLEAEGRAAGDTPLLAFWHEPRFSSGIEHGTNPLLQPLWEAAVDAGADIVLNGHDHNYERFEPLGADGQPRADGTVQFVSGNGGHNLRRLDVREPHSAVAIAGAPGVLFLSLRPDGYSWTYQDVEGRVGDSGSRRLS